jgi:hypothetical protein
MRFNPGTPKSPFGFLGWSEAQAPSYFKEI